MLRLPLPFTDATLLLTPRWNEMGTPGQIVLLALLCLMPVALVLWLYRFELRLIRRMVALGLLILRLAVLAILLLLVGFQPIFARTHQEELPGRILIAVDRSDSMDVADPQRTPADKLRMALALHLATDLASDDQLRDWIRQLDEGQAINRWVDEAEFRDDLGKRREAEVQRRDRFTQVCRRVDALTRTEAARRLLQPDGAALLATLSAKHQVELIGFSQEIREGRLEAVDDLFGPRPGPPGAAFTDLRLPLTRALERPGLDQSKVLGIVLLTDGQHDWGPSPVKTAIELGEHRLPIFPVALGDKLAPPDVAVVSVKAPSAVFKDVDLQIEARVKVSGMRDRRPLTVQLQRPGQEPLEESIAHDGTDRYHTVRFQVRLDKPGTQALSVVAKPQEGEIRPDNNSRPVVVNVADDKAKVLLVDGEARWEYHYLASALARDRTMQPQGVVFQQPRIQRVAEEELRKTGNPWLALPPEADALAAYDCIVLGDVAAAQLSLADRVRLEKYVADGGGTLVLVAGKRAMPMAYASNDAVQADGEPLRRLLPIETPRVLKPMDGFAVALTYEGKTTPFLQMEAEQDRSEARWGEFPRHFWGVVGKAKPGATVLAQAEESVFNKPGVSDQALIVRHNYGFGRVLYVGLDSTWRWRYREGDSYHHRFWGQTVRWAASEKPLVTGNEFVRFGTREAVYRQGQEIDLVMRLSEEAGSLPAGALTGARILRLKEGGGEESVALVPLGRREAQPRVFEGKIRDLPAGTYGIELAIPDLGAKVNVPGPDGTSTKLRATFRVTSPDGDELVELAANWPLLEELAAKSGGQVFPPGDAASLLEALTRRAVTREDRVENRLWQWWVILTVILSLLTLEWIGRKWAGLP